MQKDSRPLVPFDRAGWPFVAGAAICAAIAAAFAGSMAALPFILVTIVFLVFFRDPERQPPADPNAVLSPADGRVLVAGRTEPGTAPPGEWLQISIFLSPLDVHVNRVPVSGRVVRVNFRPGRYLPAYRAEAAGSNECSEIWVDHHGQSVVFRQLVGILARRVVCRLEPGRDVQAGERFGVMKFGSRMDVFLPITAVLCVAVGDSVRGGETILARLLGPVRE
jgi:phosphatidylserine decarboxylase